MRSWLTRGAVALGASSALVGLGSSLALVGLGSSLALVGLGCERVILDFDGVAAGGGTGDEGGEGGDEDEGSAPPQAPPAPELIVTERFDPSRQNSGARRCADGGDGVGYRVTALDGARVTLASSPSEGCLSAGDEVLLIKLQGSSASRANVGRAELLRVLEGEGARVTLVSPVLGSYGAREGENAELGEGVVRLLRVPNYSRVVVESGAVLSAPAWDGEEGGVLVVRALGDWVIDGVVTMSAAGFRGGPSVEEPLGDGVAGESLGGLGAGRAPNGGGGGGGSGDRTTSGCVQDGNAGGGGGHAQAGADGVVEDRCEGEGRGLGGEGYARAGRIFLGSGGGSGGVDNVRVDNPPSGAGGTGGGIVFLLGQSLSGGGRIEARGGAGVGDEPDVECESGYETTRCYDHSGPGGGGAGGTIRLDVAQASGVTLSVDGGRGGNGFDASTGDGGEGAAGVLLGTRPGL